MDKKCPSTICPGDIYVHVPFVWLVNVCRLIVHVTNVHVPFVQMRDVRELFVRVEKLPGKDKGGVVEVRSMMKEGVWLLLVKS